VRERVGQLKTLWYDIEYADLLGNGRSNAMGAIWIPLHPNALQLVIVDLEAADCPNGHAVVSDFQLGGGLHGQQVLVVGTKLQISDLCCV
jgi:hypothetical protein